MLPGPLAPVYDSRDRLTHSLTHSINQSTDRQTDSRRTDNRDRLTTCDMHMCMLYPPPSQQHPHLAPSGFPSSPAFASCIANIKQSARLAATRSLVTAFTALTAPDPGGGRFRFRVARPAKLVNHQGAWRTPLLTAASSPPLPQSRARPRAECNLRGACWLAHASSPWHSLSPSLHQPSR